MTATQVYLSPGQVDKLRRVLSPTIPIYPSPLSPTSRTLHIIPKDFLRQLLLKLEQNSIHISDIRLNGGAASYVLIKNSNFVYRDIDILFCIDTPLSSQRLTTLFSSTNEPYLCEVWTIIKYIVCSCLIEYMPEIQTCTPSSVSSILDTYTKKNIQITSEQDSWALLSLQNLLGRNLELKFIERLKRQWQFSVDSFQIDLQSLLFERCSSLSQSSIRPTSTNDVRIEAFNAINIRNTNQTSDTSTTPLQFGSFTPATTHFLQMNNQTIHCQTITTIDTSNTRNTKSRSRPMKPSCDDDLSDSSLQFQISLNEDIDDGIVVDTDDSTVEDDEPVLHSPSVKTPPSFPIDYPTSSAPLAIEVTCAYKDLNEAIYHLNNKLIATYEPEKLRGGGLLKYCDLLAQNYKPYDPHAMAHMQRYMCSRYFIDFKTLPEQISTIAKYVATHFLPSSAVNDLHETKHLHEIMQHLQLRPNQPKDIDATELINTRLCLLFFDYLTAVICESTVCLTGDDKDILLMQISWLRECYHYEYEYLFENDQEHIHRYHYSSPPQYPHVFNNSHRFAVTSKSYGYHRSHNPRYSQSPRQVWHGQRYCVHPTNRRYQW